MPQDSSDGSTFAAKLERAIGYSFRNAALLRQALTHRSASRDHNERLEFLGDAVLGLVAAEMLFDTFPSMREGPLTRARASMVRRESLASIARELDLGRYLSLGPGELKSGGRNRDSILADGLEAVLGAVHLDGGFEASVPCAQRLLEPRLAGLNDARPDKDPKTRLQEQLQGRGLDLPNYEVTSVTGSAHEQTFTVSCTVSALELVRTGIGSSRRQAEQQAAEALLEVINDR